MSSVAPGPSQPGWIRYLMRRCLEHRRLVVGGGGGAEREGEVDRGRGG
ncbi:hypothetical protein [Nocardia abscessus]|nr:hypothetical protein [Nocardia abscessus]